MILGRLLFGLPLFGASLLYVANPGWMAWAELTLPGWARWAGVGLGALVVASVDRVLRHLGSNVSETVLTKHDHELVTTGPYRWVRHPLYTTGIALFVAIGLMSTNGFILVWTGLAALAIRLVVIPREESALVETFGDRYLAYRRSTASLLPGLRGSRRILPHPDDADGYRNERDLS